MTILKIFGILITLSFLGLFISCHSVDLGKIENIYQQYVNERGSVNNLIHFVQTVEKNFEVPSREESIVKMIKMAYAQPEKWDYLLNSLDQYSIPELLSYFNTNYGDSSHFSELQRIIYTNNDPNINSLSPNILFNDRSGNQHKLSDYKGKFIVIDFWAVWCKACLELEPNFHSIVQKYTERDDIIFLSISVHGKDKLKWENHIDKSKQKLENHIHGIFADKNSASLADDFFDLYSLPRFAFIDKEGKMIFSRGPKPNSKFFCSIIKDTLSK